MRPSLLLNAKAAVSWTTEITVAGRPQQELTRIRPECRVHAKGAVRLAAFRYRFEAEFEERRRSRSIFDAVLAG
jgi:hypothetical protein